MTPAHVQILEVAVVRNSRTRLAFANPFGSPKKAFVGCFL